MAVLGSGPNLGEPLPIQTTTVGALCEEDWNLSECKTASKKEAPKHRLKHGTDKNKSTLVNRSLDEATPTSSLPLPGWGNWETSTSVMLHAYCQEDPGKQGNILLLPLSFTSHGFPIGSLACLSTRALGKGRRSDQWQPTPSLLLKTIHPLN